jgi:acetyl-CoA synthetase
VIWKPTEDVLAQANVVRLMSRHGFDDYWELVRRSQEDPQWFWPAAIEDMGLEFSAPWREVVDLSRGPEWATWFVGGRLNIAWNCVHRWAERRPDAVAAVSLAEDGGRRELSFSELSRDVTRLAEALVRLGVGEGDRVAIFLPMSQEVAIASHACAHIGAIQVPIFSGFAAPAVAQRLQASEAKVAITTRTAARRGREVPMLEILEEARGEAPLVEHVVLAPWDDLVADCPTRRARPGRPRASSTFRAGSSSRSPARSATRPTGGPMTSSTSRPTWAGSWGRGPLSAAARWARRSSSPKARRTGPWIGSGS